MKKLLLLPLLFIGIFIFGQGTPFPGYQQMTNSTTKLKIMGAVQATNGMINGAFADTATANSSTHIDFYPGAQIYTTDKQMLWLRNNTATKWLPIGVGITTVTFYTDSSMIICYGNGVCDTISFVNNVFVTNNDNTVTVFNDSTLIICSTPVSGPPVCDTISFNIDSINNYYFLNDSTIVACDTVQVITLGDSSYTQQLCDTINIPRRTSLVLQNGLQFVAPGIGEFGHTTPDPNPSQLQKDTYLYTDFYNFGISGAPYLRPTLSVQNKQWTQISSSITSFNSLGGNPFQFNLEPDNINPVNLYVNYMNRFIEGSGVFAGDTIGTMYDRIGYSLMTNAQGARAGYDLQSTTAKQSGIMFHTFDTQYTDAVTIFGNQTPNRYLFSVSPFPTTTLLDSRIAVFKTGGQVQFPEYIALASFPGTAVGVIGFDASGNLLTIVNSGGGGTLTAANNGTSLSSTTVQLGQAVAAVGDPAILLSHREIPMGNFTLSLNASAAQSNNIFQTKNSSAAIRARITSAADFSNTGGQTNSEKFGDGATVSGTGAVSIGRLTVAGGNNDVVIGNASNSNTAGGNTIVGTSITVSSAVTGLVAVGSTITIGGSNNAVAIGSGAVVSTRGTGVGYAVSVTGALGSAFGDGANVAHQASIALGFEATSTAANQFVVGGAGALSDGVTDAYWGRGVASTIANNFKMQPTGASGLNMAGNTFTIAGSPGTGNATPGIIIFQTSTAGASSSTLQTLASKIQINGSGVLSYNGVMPTSGSGGTDSAIFRNSSSGQFYLAPGGAGGGFTTADNGLTANTATNVQLGGTLINATTTIAMGGNVFRMTNSGEKQFFVDPTNYIYSLGASEDAGDNWALEINGNPAGTRTAKLGSLSGGTYIQVANANRGLDFFASGSNIFEITNTGSFLENQSSVTNTVYEMFQLRHVTTTTAADGFGQAFDFYLESASGATQLSNGLHSRWTTAANATRTSEFSLTGVNSATTRTLMTLGGAGLMTLGVSGTNTGSLAFAGVTSGLITIQPASAAGTYTLTLPTTDGGASEFLQTDGNGVLTWASAAGGAPAWNDITSPTGSQALTFGAAENSVWTDQNTTADNLTINSSTGTTNSLISLNRTGTALAAGNNIAEFISTGANGTNAITVTGIRSSVTNTNATSGTNVALSLTASGATTANQAINVTAGQVVLPTGSTTVPALMIGSSGIFESSGIGFGLYTGGFYRAFIGDDGLLFRETDAVLDIGNANLGTTNRFRLSGTAEGAARFATTAATAAVTIQAYGGEGATAGILISPDEADDATDTWTLQGQIDNDFALINNSVEYMNVTSAGVVTLSNLAGTGSRTVLADANGVLSAPVSDFSVKQNIQSLNYGLNTIMQLNPVSFEYKDGWKNYGQGMQIGFIAQDVQSVLPSITFTTPSTGKMGYDELSLIPILVQGMKEQQQQIEELKKEIKSLKQK